MKMEIMADSETRGAFIAGIIIVTIGLIFEDSRSAPILTSGVSIHEKSRMYKEDNRRKDRKEKKDHITSETVNVKIDLVSAEIEKLVLIKGVGLSTAESIKNASSTLIEGGYSALIDIRGIGPAKQKSIMKNGWLPPVSGAVQTADNRSPRLAGFRKCTISKRLFSDCSKLKQ